MWQLLWILVAVLLATAVTVWSADTAHWDVSLTILIVAGVTLGMLIATVTYGLARSIARRRRRIFRRKSGRFL